MKTRLMVSSRGQLTLPSELRKKYGIDEGSVLIAEDRNGEIVLRPTAVVEVEYYTDPQIKAWMAEDQISSDTVRDRLRSKLKKISK